MNDVSVVVPTRNRSVWLGQCLRSVLGQIDVDLELIVVDDGSTDDTTDVVTGLGDRRIVMIHHDQPRGVSASRNRGAERATGEWLAFLDDDDLWSPHKLRRQIDAAIDSGRAWVYAGCVNVDEAARILGGSPPPPPETVARSILRSNVIPGGGSNVLMRRDEFRTVGPFDLRLKNTEDWEMWIRLAKRGMAAWVREPLIGYRLHAGNSSLDVRAIFEGIALIERRHGTRVARGELHRWIAQSCLRTGQKMAWLKFLSLAAARGEVPGVANDLADAFRWKLRRYARRPVPTLGDLPHSEWTRPAQEWLDHLLASGLMDGPRSACRDDERAE